MTPAAAPTESGPTGTTGTAGPVPALLLCALVVAIPLASAHWLWSDSGAADWTRSVVVAPFDLVLVLVVAFSATVPDAWRSLFRTRLSQAAAATFAVGALIALLAHPSWLGAALLLRLAAGLAVVVVGTLALGEPRSRLLVLGTITAVGVAQAALAAIQSARGEAFGVGPFDYAGPLYPFGTSFAGRGGLTHPYHLAVLLLVAQGAALLGLRSDPRRWPWLLALAAINVGVGVTYTRAGLIGQVVVVAVALVARRAGPTRLAAVAIAAGLVLGGFAFGDGWVSKAETTAGADGNVTSSRTERLREAADLVRDEPQVGVGPGRYVSAQAAYDRPELLPAHNLVAHETAELGIVGALGTLLLLAALVRRTLRGGAWALMVALPMAGFLALDAYPYVFATGLALSAVWLALVRAAADDAPLTTAMGEPMVSGGPDQHLGLGRRGP